MAESAVDILTTFANMSSDEVYTPPRVVRSMLELLPDELFFSPDTTFLDPCVKSGVFLREIAKRLFDCLDYEIPDPLARREHILRRQVFGMATSKVSAMLGRQSLYQSKDASHKTLSAVPMESPEGNISYPAKRHDVIKGRCERCGAPADLPDKYAYPFIHLSTEELSTMKFDVVIGNPPYQVETVGNTRTIPIYQNFIKMAKDLNPPFVSMIVPSRWMAGGLGLDDFRAEMLSDHRITRLVDYVYSEDCFPDVSIRGGVCYFLWDRDHVQASDGKDCLLSHITNGAEDTPVLHDLAEDDVLIRFEVARDILKKVRSYNDSTLDTRVSSTNPFGLPSNFVGHHSVPSEGDLGLYMRNQTKVFISPDRLPRRLSSISSHKVMISEAYGAGDDRNRMILGKPFYAEPDTACTQTYVVLDWFQTREEADNCISYVKTKFFRFLVSLRKISQHTTPKTYSFVPLLDMTRSWTDEDLFERYGLTEDEIGYIISEIGEMK